MRWNRQRARKAISADVQVRQLRHELEKRRRSSKRIAGNVENVEKTQRANLCWKLTTET